VARTGKDSIIKTKVETNSGAAVSSSDLVSTEYQYRHDFESHKLDPVTFHRMNSPFYTGERWAVRRLSSCLNSDGEWEYEPMPSSRNDAFYARCRFDTLEAAKRTLESANTN
jgi:hypothetical protein